MHANDGFSFRSGRGGALICCNKSEYFHKWNCLIGQSVIIYLMKLPKERLADSNRQQLGREVYAGNEKNRHPRPDIISYLIIRPNHSMSQVTIQGIIGTLL